MSGRSGSDFGTLGNKHVLDDGDDALLLIAGKVADFLENAAQLPGRAGTVVIGVRHKLLTLFLSSSSYLLTLSAYSEVFDAFKCEYVNN